MKSKMLLKSLLFIVAIILLPENAVAQKNSFQLSVDKNMTDAQLKKDETDAKKFDFEVSFTGVKRNDKKEITAIKIAYKDKDGNSGNYNVSTNSPISPIVLIKQFDGTGKGTINIQSGENKNNMFFADAFGNNNMRNFGGMFNNDMFKEFMNGREFNMENDFNNIDLDKLKELQKGFSIDSLDNNFQSFTFKDGDILGNNPDMKLEEESTDENGTTTKKYSDGKGNTMIFSENFGSGNQNELGKMKIERNFNSNENSKSDLEKLKQELEKTKTDLEKLKIDLQKDKGEKGTKGKK